MWGRGQAALKQLRGLCRRTGNISLWFGLGLVGWLGGGGSVQAATVFGATEGLPNTLVQAIAVNPNGELWIGTQEGLSAFDGHRFETLKLSSSGQVPDEHAARLLIDGKRMLVATSSGLLRVDLPTRAVTAVHAATGDLPGLQAIWRDEAGAIWLGDEQGHLWWLANVDATPRQIILQGVPEIAGISHITGNAERLWLSTATGVLEVDRQNRTAAVLTPAVAGFVPTDPYVQTIFLDARNRLWIGYWNDGLVRLDRATGVWTWFHPDAKPSSGLSATSIWNLTSYADQIHVATNRGIDVFDESCQCFRRLSHPDWDKVDGNGVIVTDLQADRSGLWAAVWGRGLVRFNAGDRFFERLVPMDEHPESLAHPMVYALKVDRQDRLWVGTYGAFAQFVNADDRPAGGHWRLQSVPRRGLRTEARFVWAIGETPDGMALGTGYGLFGTDGAAVRVLAPDLQSTRSLLLHPDGRLLVGGVRGLWQWDQERLTRVTLPETMRSPVVHCMLWHDDSVWLGGPKGLTRLDSNLQWLASYDVGTGPSALPGPVVWDIKAAADGRIWVGTSGGLVALDRRGDSYVLEQHLWPEQQADRSIASVEFAGPDTLWLGTSRGLLRYRADTRELRKFDVRDGLISDQFHHGASASDGRRLYFGSTGGLLAFDPREAPEQTYQLRPSLAKIKIGMQPWQAPDAFLALPDRPPSLQVQLSAYQFERPERVRFAYRWLPEEREFSDLGDAHQAVFSDLPSGERTLELRATLDGYTVSRPVLRVQVAYAWHETWWGRLLLGFVAIAGTAAYYLRRIRAIRSNAEALRLEVQARTRALSHTSAELAAANARLKEQVETDALTGIRNRHFILNRIEHWHQQGRALGVLLIDLDHFKRINDTHGHLVGDRVLLQFARTLTESLPEFLCARFGGEEFFAFRETTDLQLLLERAHQMRSSVHRLRVPDDQGQPVRITVSVGVAVLAPGESVNDLIKRADAAMYRAKAQGRDRIDVG
ncbi:hypothetical protein C7S18_10745 [Ahniella affigens]|uniref:diguanylate cyclase n=1 Tax=Ahniella affigens TaxID=2021234 RepID=A0A2P1PS23_9GAMM|nr:ligand-binding sensor domain-containing diguanylate cyclase [Ahniella affigens]AVP97647.1 hypothetical protein C7S18_10745 [Ahniella affigens]